MRIVLYGGFAEKGRTCVGIEAAGRRILLDVGVKTSARGGADYYPAIAPAALAALDAIVVTHAHEDHAAALGFAIAHGFRGRILMTRETARDLDACLVAYAEPAHARLVRDAALETLAVGDSAARFGTLVLSTGRSGHVPGGVWCVVDDGSARVVYCSDVAPGSAAFTMDPPPRGDALVIDASYGDDNVGTYRRAAEIADWIGAHPDGCVLPTPLVGRSAELLAFVPGVIALAPGMRDALAAQAASGDWLADGIARTLGERLAAATDWRAGDALPRAALLCHDGMGISGSSPGILAQARAERHPTLFTGHLPGRSLGEAMVAEGSAQWLRLPTHPTLAENVALVAASGAALVLGHSCDRAALARLAPHLPRLRADAATGDRIDIVGR